MKEAELKSLREVSVGLVLFFLLTPWVPAWGASTDVPQEGPKGPLIPRKLFFGNPDAADVFVSPDGKWLSYLAPRNGVLNLWIAPIDHLDRAKCLTDDHKRNIRNQFWTYDSRYLLYSQDLGGDEDWHIHLVTLESGKNVDLTPFKKTAAWILGLSPNHPDELLVELNRRDPKYHDLFRMSLPDGKMTEVFRNTGQYKSFYPDYDLKLRMVSKETPDGGVRYYRVDVSGKVTPFFKVAGKDTLTTYPLGFLATGKAFYLASSQGRDKGALYQCDFMTGSRKLLSSDSRCDVGRALRNPRTGKLEAVAFYYLRQQWKANGSAVKGDLAFLKGRLKGDFEILSRTLDDRLWSIIEWVDDGTAKYYLFDRRGKDLRFLMPARKALLDKPLAKMRPEVVTTRDGLKMVCYLTLPVWVKGDKPDHPLPMVLFVHGGPWARDLWGYNPFHQLLANRGYAVLSVNYRGSTGFGKSFINAGNLEWGRKMQNDLTDSVDWAVREGIADKEKVAIMGGSYGGYATLAGLAFTPTLYRCGVDIVGPSNLNTLLATIPPYWTSSLQLFYKRMGDPRTAKGRKLLDDRSPLNHADAMVKPLLIGQGANDPRVKRAESDTIVKALQDRKVPVIYLLFPDEGHGFARPENNLAFISVTEAFLAKYLGGRAEPVGNAYQGSSVQFLAGKDAIPGLK
jgi:dipeptidyl aminopeptidase/acylaminoacyl peptidase